MKIGIDLGTTFCAVARMDEKKGQPVIIPIAGGKIVPSVIQFFPDGDISVGVDAKEAYEAGEPGCASNFKRGMGKPGIYCSVYDREYTAEDLSAILLSYLKEEAEAQTGEKVEEAVITVPAYFYHKERQATMRAAKKAGLNVRQIINEPTAAAMNYGVNHWRENARIMVYDLGGGTFDVTLVQMGKGNQMSSKATLGNHTLGGKDWDERLTSLIENRIEEETGVVVADYVDVHQTVCQSVESIKRSLTTHASTKFTIRLPDYGAHTLEISRSEFDSCTVDLLERTGTLCEKILTDLKIKWQDITDVLLVGGSTRMPQVSAYIKRMSGHTPLNQVHPDEAVALGAAIQVHLPLPEYIDLSMEIASAPASGGGFRFRKARGGQEPAAMTLGVVGKETYLETALSMQQRDVVAHAMGVIAVDESGTRYINRTIVPANQSIPVKCAESFHFYTTSGGDNEVEIYMLQGTKSPVEAEVIGKYVASGIQHNREKNPTTIRIQYSYDINGIVHVQVRQENNNYDLPIREEPVPADMSQFGRPVEVQAPVRAEDLSVVMVIDASYSMVDDPLRDAKKAMCHFVDTLSDYPGHVEIGVVAVADRSVVIQELTDHFSTCKKKINGIECGVAGIANDAQPFDDVLRMLQRCRGRKFSIVLADGMWQNQSTAIQRAQNCWRSNIDITGIGFGSADEKFIRAISSGDVQAMLVSQSELTQSFGKIAQAIGGSAPGKSGKSGGQDVCATWLAIGE